MNGLTGLDLPGPSRRIRVEPLRLPQPARKPERAPAPPKRPAVPKKKPARA